MHRESKSMTVTEIININEFNRMAGRESLHPLVCMAYAGEPMRCSIDFYALLYICGKQALRLFKPGETIELEGSGECRGVMFHPDLLCATPLGESIASYPGRCRCKGGLDGRETGIIDGCLAQIEKELHHDIDRHSAAIIASQIELLLNYCTRFCNK